MWIGKIRCGMLEVQTDQGVCYLRPSLGERIRLLWTFRNFHLLPRQVLNQRELTLVAALLERGNFQPNGDWRIGIIEWTPPPPLQPAPSAEKQTGPAAANTKPSSPTTPASNVRSRSRRRRGKKRSQRAATLQVGITAAFPAKPR